MPHPIHYILTLEIFRDSTEAIADQLESDWGFNVIQLERPGHDHAWLEVYFEDMAEAEVTAAVVRDWPSVRGVQIRRESPRDWQTFWRHHFHTTEIGRHLKIVPVWEKDNQANEPSNRKVIWLDPGLSFGTGDHFTTRFCLEMIDRFVPDGSVKSMLDIGTGSSILAIAAKLLGAERVVGTDHDAIALEQARENLKLNGFEAQIELSVSDILQESPKGSFDLVCANVYTTILIEIAPSVCAAAKHYVVLSGIRDPELELVAETYRALGLKEVFRDGNGEWGCLAFKNVNGNKS